MEEQDETNVLKFYRVSDELGEFSNFAKYPLLLDGKEWPTSEHYFQSQKFADEDYQEQIRTTSSPSQAAKLGRSRKIPIVQNWEEVKDNVMRKAVAAKVAQHKHVRDLLISTGDMILVELTRNDSYWGDGGDGSGKNMLGVILMEERQKVRSELYCRKWAELANGVHPFTIFENGTCVFLKEPEQDLSAQAKRLLVEFGPVVVGAPSADFTVTELDFEQGWIVSFDHQDVMTFVAVEEFYGLVTRQAI